jgi:hypothetical protein
MPNCRRISAQLCDSWRWPTRTPFGDDVLPEVYCTKATPSTGSGGDKHNGKPRGKQEVVRPCCSGTN